jgi:hypothetical protein
MSQFGIFSFLGERNVTSRRLLKTTMGIFGTHAEAFTRLNLHAKAFQESGHVVGCDGILCDCQVSLFSYVLNFYKT